ncbi:MAG: hypothetical protein LH660_15690 [Phormidesmis sp. CAN_BIN36]|nr:hypothetical protein [Phormidesmis sp. CAN_BIN36]
MIVERIAKALRIQVVTEGYMMTQSNDLPTRISRTEDNIIDLRLAASALLQATDKNSTDIAALIEVCRRNSEAIAVVNEISRRNSEAIAVVNEISRRNSEAIPVLQASQLRTDETIREIRATNERMDRLFDYLIRRDRPQPE